MGSKLSLASVDIFYYDTIEVIQMTTSITGARIRHARKHADLTIKKLAELIHVTERSIKRYESGQSTPDTHVLIHLACIFDLSTDYLLGLSDRADTSFLDQYRTNNIYYQNLLSNTPISTEDYFCVEKETEKDQQSQTCRVLRYAGNF